MPDNTMLLNFVASAFVCAAVISVLVYATRRSCQGYLAGLLVGALIPVAPIVGQYLSEGLEYPPSREWYWVSWLVALCSLTLGVLQVRSLWNPIPALVVAALTWFGCQKIFPAIGSEPEFDLVRNQWLATSVLAAFGNCYLLRAVCLKDGSRWVTWLLVAQLGLTSVATMTVYATLAAATLGYLALAFVMAVAAIAISPRAKQNQSPHPESLPGDRPTFLWNLVLIGPLVLSAILMTLCFRGYNYSAIPFWLYLVMLILPSVLAIVDLWLLKGSSTIKRVSVAAGLALLLVVIPIAVLMQSSEASEW